MSNFANKFIAKSMRVLLIGTMGDTGPTVRECLERHGISVFHIDFPQNTFKDEPGYQRALKRGVESFHPDLILPIGHQLALSRLKSTLPEGIKVPVDVPAKIELLDSKVRVSALAGELSIAQPKIFANLEEALEYAGGSETSAEGVRMHGEKGSVILKRDSSFGGSGVFRPWTAMALKRLVENELGRPFLLEEYVEGFDLSVDCIKMGDFFRAGCYKTTCRKQGQGPSTQRILVECPDAVATARRILEHVDYNGVCGMDFRVRTHADGSSEILFLECNPRFCGGLKTQIEGGFEIPFILVDITFYSTSLHL